MDYIKACIELYRDNQDDPIGNCVVVDLKTPFSEFSDTEFRKKVREMVKDLFHYLWCRNDGDRVYVYFSNEVNEIYYTPWELKRFHNNGD